MSGHTFTKRDYNRQLSRVAKYINANREIIDDIEGETSDGHEIHGYLFTHGNEQLAVIAPEHKPYFRIDKDITQDILQGVAVKVHISKQTKDIDPKDPSAGATIKKKLSGGEIEYEQSEVKEALREIYDDFSNDDMISLRLRLLDKISSPHTSYDIKDFEGGPATHGFVIRRKIYVYEDSFSFSNFDIACQEVMSSAVPGKEFLAHMLNLMSVTIKADDDDEGSDVPPGMFQ